MLWAHLLTEGPYPAFDRMPNNLDLGGKFHVSSNSQFTFYWLGDLRQII